MLTIEEPSSASRILENFEKLGIKHHAEVLTTQQIRERWDGLYADADCTDIKDGIWNPESGWAEAAKALEATIQAAVENGVVYVSESAVSLLRDGDVCQDVMTETGNVFPDDLDLQAGKRIIAAGVCEAAVQLSDEQRAIFQEVPVFVLDANETRGETIPPTPEGELKFTRDIKFTNTLTDEKSGKQMLVPLIGKHTSQWTDPDKVPLGLGEEIGTVIEGIYGKHGTDLTPAKYRFCWDAGTQDNNFMISPHPRVPHLFFATMGTWHSWRFLPILGKYVVNMLDGNLGEEEKGRWDWNRKMDKVKRDIPSELKDTKGYQEEEDEQERKGEDGKPSCVLL